jgi:hypothetical protein
VRKLALPDVKAALKGLLEDKQKNNDEVVKQLLELF